MWSLLISKAHAADPVIYLDRRLFGAAGWRLSALAVDPVILQLAWRGFKAVERLERQIYT